MAKEKNSVTIYRSKTDVVVGEHRGAVEDIRAAREKLGEMSLRDMTEAIMGDEFAEIIYGNEGGNIKMKDVKHGIHRVGSDGFSTNIDQNQLRQIMIEAHPDKSPDEITAMISAPNAADKLMITKALNEQDVVIAKAQEESMRAIAEANNMSLGFAPAQQVEVTEMTSLDESDLDSDVLTDEDKALLRQLLEKAKRSREI